MPLAPHDNSAVQPSENFSVAEIFAIRGMNTNENPLSLNTDEMSVFENFILGPRHMKRRLGSALTGSEPGSGAITKVLGLGHLEQDSGITLLMLGNNGTLYKLSAGTWTASDKTNYNTTADAQIITFSTKSGTSLANGTTTSGTTKYIIEDASKTWTPDAYAGKCVLILGEVKYILSNTETTLFLSDRLNLDTDADYNAQTYNIYDVTPQAIISNGVGAVQKYNLTAHVALDGTHVTDGEALKLFKHIAAHQGRFWGAVGSGDDNDRVFISDLAVAEQFTKDTNLNVNLSFLNDGDEVTGIASLPLINGSVLLVTKNESVHSVEGDNVLNYAVHARFTKGGCIAPKTLKVSGRSALMLGYDGVLRFSGDGGVELIEKPIPVSESIGSELAAFSESDRRAACAEVWDNKYFMAVGSRMYIYDIVESIRRQQHIWSTLSYPFTFSWLHAAGNVLYGGSKTSGKVYQLFTGNDDDGERITATLETSWMTAPGAPVWYVDRIEIGADEGEDVVERLAYAKDGGDYGSWLTQTLDEALGIYRFTIRERATSFKFKFLDNATVAPPKIAMPIRIFYSIDNSGLRETKANLTLY